MMPVRPANLFRHLLSSPGLLIAPGAYDALTARLIEQAGFPLVYMTGAVALSGLARTRSVPAASTSVRELFRRVGSEDWDAISHRFARR